MDEAEQAAHLGHRLVPGLLDGEQRLAGAMRALLQQQPGSAALHRHDAHAVGDHVVEVASDAGALGRDGGTGPLVALAREPLRLRLERVRPLLAPAQGEGAERETDADGEPGHEVHLGVPDLHRRARPRARLDDDREGRQAERRAGQRLLAIALRAGGPAGEDQAEHREGRALRHAGRRDERDAGDPGEHERRGREREAAPEQQRHGREQRGRFDGHDRSDARGDEDLHLRRRGDGEDERVEGMAAQPHGPTVRRRARPRIGLAADRAQPRG